MTLHPTKTRIRLLADVKAGYVLNGNHSLDEDMHHHAWLVDPQTPLPIKVTARVADAERAGWVHLPEPEIAWRLTAEGEQVLADHSPSQGNAA